MNSSVDRLENDRVEEGHPESSGAAPELIASARRSAHAIPGLEHGWLSRLRSYFFYDPLIWLYTIVMGLLALPG